MPSPSLCAVPFAALSVPGQSDYTPLIGQAEVVLAPQGVTAFYQRDKAPRGDGVTIIADPGDPCIHGIADAMEAARPGAIVRQYTLEQGATLESLAEVMRGQRYLHVSRGDSISGAALGSAAISRLYEIPDYLDLAFIGIQSDSLRPPQPGAEILALARAWLRVSRHVVLFLGSDLGDSTTDLVVDFYQAVGQGLEPVAALAQVQRRCLAAESPRSGRPLLRSRLIVLG